jgi:serine/threonine protein kinase
MVTVVLTARGRARHGGTSQDGTGQGTVSVTSCAAVRPRERVMPELPMVGDEFAGFRLRSVLGRGGMSVVYQAENPRLGSVIALKVLAPELAADDAFRARFLEESRIAASLNHPNVIPVCDMGSCEDLLYIAMRYVSGTDLREVLKKRGRIAPAAAVFQLGQAARALDAAHRKGLVHRDVKPGNLLIERGSDEADPDHVYLADFGITKHVMSRSGLTSTGQFLGTIDYVAPEQIRGTPVTGLADQYSLGCVLYECLTGRLPFEKDLDAAVIWAHVQETPPMPTTLRPELPPEIDEVFGRVLAKRPADRYRDCREFIEAARAGLGSLAAAPPAGRLTEKLAPVPQDLAPARSVSAGPQPAREDQGDTTTSHYWPAAGVHPGETGKAGDPQPPPGRPVPRRRRFPRSGWLMALAALILVAAGAGTWVLASAGPGSHAGRDMAMPSSSASPKAPASALMTALRQMNKYANAAGKLPPSSCRPQSTTMVTCTAPAVGITEVVFRTYPSLQALYAAYMAKVKALNSGHFQPNYQDCSEQEPAGEISWNHNFRHSGKYSVAQLTSGQLDPVKQAAGRVSCNYINGQEYMVWTQNDGHLLASVAGPAHEPVWQWWVAVHHNIGFAGPPMNM